VVRITIAIALAALRVGGHRSEAFQATAHLFVGGLLAYGWSVDKSRLPPSTWQLSAWLAVLLTAVEVACFLWFNLSE
jgi:hypothetical protein